MEKYPEFNFKPGGGGSEHQLGTYFNNLSTNFNLISPSESYNSNRDGASLLREGGVLRDIINITYDSISKQLELVKCNLCGKQIDMYIDIEKNVYKSFYCVTCINNKPHFIVTNNNKSTSTPSSFNNTQPELTVSRSSTSESTNSTSNRTQNIPSNSSRNLSSSSHPIPLIKTEALSQPSAYQFLNEVGLTALVSSSNKKSKLKLKPSSMVACCCDDSIHQCNRYHFLHLNHDVPHPCEKSNKGGTNKRSWSVTNRRSWSNEQKEVIYSYFSQQIEHRSTIGKDDIVPLIELNKELFADRSWKEIKWVYYHHLKVLENRKLKLRNNMMELPTEVV